MPTHFLNVVSQTALVIPGMTPLSPLSDSYHIRHMLTARTQLKRIPHSSMYLYPSSRSAPDTTLLARRGHLALGNSQSWISLRVWPNLVTGKHMWSVGSGYQDNIVILVKIYLFHMALGVSMRKLISAIFLDKGLIVPQHPPEVVL